jgi:SAM-dependent methyltransferase
VSLDPNSGRPELACIDVATMRGLEIGPLAAPKIHKSEGNVLYVDHMDAAGLRSKYATNPVMKNCLDQIVDIDYVMDGTLELHEAVGDDAPFDYVMASHLIEHIPDPVSWLFDIAKILVPGGVLSLIIPDKRFTFDINRRTTEISDLVDAYLRVLRKPSFRQAYDFISHEITDFVDPAVVWAGRADFAGVVRSDVPDPDVAALQLCRTIGSSNDYVDIHCSVFTPASFLELFEKLVRLGLIDFEVAHFVPTKSNKLEFHVSLRRMDTALDRAVVIERQLASIPLDAQSTEIRAAGIDGPNKAPIFMGISHREQMLITTKRRILGKLRNFSH